MYHFPPSSTLDHGTGGERVHHPSAAAVHLPSAKASRHELQRLFLAGHSKHAERTRAVHPVAGSPSGSGAESSTAAACGCVYRVDSDGDCEIIRGL